MAIGLYDLDKLKYQCSFIGQESSITVTNEEHGIEEVFKNRTEFCGVGKKPKNWLKDYNERVGAELTWPDFNVVEEYKKRPFSVCKKAADSQIQKDFDSTNMDSMKCYVGLGDDFRLNKSTLMKYKGQRTKPKPIWLDDLTQYLIKRYDPIQVTGIECDDRLVMDAYQKPEHVIIGVDKDFYGQPVNFLNLNKVGEGVVNGDCLGKLWIEETKSGKVVRGYGRKFLYFQTISGDPVDHYKANCFSKYDWGDISAYKELVECKTDKECWQAMLKTFKYLYPRAKTIEGWRGDKIKINALYVFQEMFDMARMLRFEGDEVLVKDVLKKVGVK